MLSGFELYPRWVPLKKMVTENRYFQLPRRLKISLYFLQNFAMDNINC